MRNDSQSKSAAPAGGGFKPHNRLCEFLCFAVLPLVITMLAMMLGASWLLNGIARSVNAQEEARSWEAAQSAVAALEDRLKGIVTDNVNWDDAVRATYSNLDAEWVANMWGVGSVNYDTMFLLSPYGKSLIAFRQNKRFDGTARDYLGGLLPKLLNTLAEQGSSFSSVSTLANTSDGLAIVAAGPVLPSSPGLPIGQEEPNVAVFIDLLTPEAIAGLGRQYTIDGLQLVPAEGAAQAAHVLANRWGEPVAAVKWMSRDPGRLAKASYRTQVIGILLALLGSILPLTIIHFRRLRELEASQRQALFAARHDMLTGLLTRNAFIADVKATRAARPGDTFTLLLIDIGDTRDISDSHGLTAADDVIKEVTTRFARTLGQDALLSYFGSGRFCLGFSGPDGAAQADAAASRAIKGLSNAVSFGTGSIMLPVSIGVAADSGSRVSADELLREADMALHHARQTGPGQWRRFDPDWDMRGLQPIAAQ